MILVLKQALEALEANYQLINGTRTKGGLAYCMDGYYSDCFDVDPINKQTDEAIAAIKEALAQPNQSVAGYCKKIEDLLVEIDVLKAALAQPEQEPVADDFFRMIADRNPKPFSTPQRTWVDLADDEEIADYLGDEYHTMTDSDLRFFRLGIAAAKEKNT